MDWLFQLLVCTFPAKISQNLMHETQVYSVEFMQKTIARHIMTPHRGTHTPKWSKCWKNNQNNRKLITHNLITHQDLPITICFSSFLIETQLESSTLPIDDQAPPPLNSSNHIASNRKNSHRIMSDVSFGTDFWVWIDTVPYHDMSCIWGSLSLLTVPVRPLKGMLWLSLDFCLLWCYSHLLYRPHTSPHVCSVSAWP